MQKTKEIIQILKKIKAKKKRVKISKEEKDRQKRLFKLLNEELSHKIIMEPVEKKQSMKNIKKKHNYHKDSIDVRSTIKISIRNGHRKNEKKQNGKNY